MSCTGSQPPVYLGVAVVALEDNLKSVVIEIPHMDIKNLSPSRLWWVSREKGKYERRRSWRLFFFSCWNPSWSWHVSSYNEAIKTSNLNKFHLMFATISSSCSSGEAWQVSMVVMVEVSRSGEVLCLCLCISCGTALALHWPALGLHCTSPVHSTLGSIDHRHSYCWV